MTEADVIALRTDPDFRRTPRTDAYCALCQRDITGEHAWGFLMSSGFAIVHPLWAVHFANVGEDHELCTPGWSRIGPECAKKFPAGWTVKERPPSPEESAKRLDTTSRPA